MSENTVNTESAEGTVTELDLANPLEETMDAIAEAETEDPTTYVFIKDDLTVAEGHFRKVSVRMVGEGDEARPARLGRAYISASYGIVSTTDAETNEVTEEVVAVLTYTDRNGKSKSITPAQFASHYNRGLMFNAFDPSTLVKAEAPTTSDDNDVPAGEHPLDDELNNGPAPEVTEAAAPTDTELAELEAELSNL